MAKILIIHPYDKTTIFLEDIYNTLLTEMSEYISVFKIEPTYNSHSKALREIKEAKYETIIFMGHGRSYSLFGAKGDHYSEELEVTDIEMNSNSYLFYEEQFIHHYNIHHFENKKVFCLSCRSSDMIGNWAISIGNAKVFIGFGSIPTDEIDYKENEVITPNDIENMNLFRQMLNQIILNSFLMTLKNKMTFEQLMLLIKINVYKTIFNLFQDSLVKEDNKRKIANNLLIFKKEMKIFGNGLLRLVD